MARGYGQASAQASRPLRELFFIGGPQFDWRPNEKWRIALVGTGGISHWPATPDSGKINEEWDRQFLDEWGRCDREALMQYDDTSAYLAAGQGAFEIRTFIAVSGATAGTTGTVHHYEPIPIFSVGCTTATVDLPEVA